jgi:hypothetical protein
MRSPSHWPVFRARHSPETLGDAAADGAPLVAPGDVGATLAGKPIALDTSGSLDLARGSGGGLSYAWNFGDGAQADGATTSHIYTAPGTYAATLTVRSPSGTRQVHKTLTVAMSALYYPNPHDIIPTHTILSQPTR